MSDSPLGSATPPPPPALRKVAARFRLALAAGLFCVAAPPLYIMATTGPRFDAIYREFGIKVSPLQQLMLGAGRLLGTPAGLALMLLLTPLVCYALVLTGLPRNAVAPADDPDHVHQRPRWRRLTLIAVLLTVLSFTVSVVYLASMLLPIHAMT
ncbi:MAG TPA: hypothetical protein VFF65_01230, partial [Phycisphaerales bacterium]|nr:hypothetical protein [Phycisphaerales bacterium]